MEEFQPEVALKEIRERYKGEEESETKPAKNVASKRKQRNVEINDFPEL